MPTLNLIGGSMNRSKTFAPILAVSILTLFTGTAKAQIWRAYPASACAMETDFSGDYRLHDVGAVSNASGFGAARARRLHCPIVGDFLLRPEDIRTITVLYDDKNPESGDGTAVGIQVCVQSLAPDSRHCSDWASSVGAVRGYLNAHESGIRLLRDYAAGYFSDVVIEIPKKYGDAESLVYGIGFSYERHY
jgi:hypothetical protein